MRGLRFLILIGLGVSTPVMAHGGGLNAEGCHNDRIRGGYHCHNGGGSRPSLRQSAPRPTLPSLLFSRPDPVVEFDGRVEAIQKMLRHLGYDDVTTDGRMGGVTRQAILAFERDQGMTLTGEASATLVDALIVAVGKQGGEP